MYSPYTPSSLKSSNSNGYSNTAPYPSQYPPSISSWGTVSTSQAPYAPGGGQSTAPTQYPQAPYSPSPRPDGAYMHPSHQGFQPAALLVVPAQLHPLIDCQSQSCLNFDLAIQPMRTVDTSATNPVLQRMVVTFEGYPTWEFALESPGALTVNQILQQIYQHVQGSNTPRDTQFSRMNPMHGYDSQASPLRVNAGQSRIQALGQRRIFRGMSRARDPNNTRWIIHLGTVLPY